MIGRVASGAGTNTTAHKQKGTSSPSTVQWIGPVPHCPSLNVDVHSLDLNEMMVLTTGSFPVKHCRFIAHQRVLRLTLGLQNGSHLASQVELLDPSMTPLACMLFAVAV